MQLNAVYTDYSSSSYSYTSVSIGGGYDFNNFNEFNFNISRGGMTSFGGTTNYMTAPVAATVPAATTTTAAGARQGVVPGISAAPAAGQPDPDEAIRLEEAERRRRQRSRQSSGWFGKMFSALETIRPSWLGGKTREQKRLAENKEIINKLKADAQAAGNTALVAKFQAQLDLGDDQLKRPASMRDKSTDTAEQKQAKADRYDSMVAAEQEADRVFLRNMVVGAVKVLAITAAIAVGAAVLGALTVGTGGLAAPLWLVYGGLVAGAAMSIYQTGEGVIQKVDSEEKIENAFVDNEDEDRATEASKRIIDTDVASAGDKTGQGLMGLALCFVSGAKAIRGGVRTPASAPRTPAATTPPTPAAAAPPVPRGYWFKPPPPPATPVEPVTKLVAVQNTTSTWATFRGPTTMANIWSVPLAEGEEMVRDGVYSNDTPLNRRLRDRGRPNPLDGTSTPSPGGGTPVAAGPRMTPEQMQSYQTPFVISDGSNNGQAFG